MAARRVGAATVDWLAFAKKVPEGQKPQFIAFKSKSDGYAAKVAALPESAPAINWANYESHVNIPGMVADFKKQYESMTIPYPKDTYSNLIAEQEKASGVKVAEYVQKAQTSVDAMTKELARVEAMRPIEEMYMEEYFDAFPEQALDPFDRPTMWPHTPEVQPEYLEQMERDGKFDEEH